MVPVSCFGKVSEHFLSHPSQRLYSIQLKLKVAISENIPCHLSLALNVIKVGLYETSGSLKVRKVFSLGLTSAY